MSSFCVATVLVSVALAADAEEAVAMMQSRRSQPAISADATALEAMKLLQSFSHTEGSSSAFDLLSQLQLGRDYGSIGTLLSDLNVEDAPGISDLISDLEALVPKCLGDAHDVDQNMLDFACIEEVADCEAGLEVANLPARRSAVNQKKDDQCACRAYTLLTCNLPEVVNGLNPSFGTDRFAGKCEGTETIDRSNALASLGDGLAWYSSKLDEYTAAKAACDAASAQFEEVVKPCHAKQVALEQAYCLYQAVSQDACQAYAACRSVAVSNCDLKTDEVRPREAARREIFKQYSIVKCILEDVLQHHDGTATADSAAEMAAAADRCKSITVNADVYALNYPTSGSSASCVSEDLLTQSPSWVDAWLSCPSATAPAADVTYQCPTR